jgi:hypothetical protein
MTGGLLGDAGDGGGIERVEARGAEFARVGGLSGCRYGSGASAKLPAAKL